MKTTLKLLFACLLCCASLKADEITATILLSSTSVTNLNGTNAASITVGASTRIWTNSISSAATQISASTNLSTAVSRLLNHLKAGSYPFTGLTAYGTNSGILLVGTSGFTVTISNSWATVSYSTNTIGGGYAVRAPRTTQPATERAISDERIVDGINNAATNTISASATAMANFESVAALAQTTNILGGKNLKLAHSALAVDNAGTNFVTDFTGDEYRSITATNNVNLLQSTNRVAGGSVVIWIYPNGTNRNLTVPATWHPVSAVDAVLTNTTVGIISMTANGTSETNVFYSYKAVP